MWPVKSLTVMMNEKADPPASPVLGVRGAFFGLALLYKKAPQNLVVLHCCVILSCPQILISQDIRWGTIAAVAIFGKRNFQIFKLVFFPSKCIILGHVYMRMNLI